MLPIVLGGIAIAAAGYALKEYCDAEGCPWDESEPSKEENENNKENTPYLKPAYKEALYELGKLLRLMERGKHVDIFASYYEETPQKELPKELIEKVGEDAYFDACSGMVEKVHEIALFYHDRILRLIDSSQEQGFSKTDKKMLSYAFKFYNAMHVLLPQTSEDNKGRVFIATKEAFVRYEKVVIKHKMKISFFRVAECNYTLFLTTPEGSPSYT